MTSRLVTEVGLWVHALRFLTRLPLPEVLDYAPDLMGRAARYFALCGAVVGALLAGVWVVALLIGLPPLLAAGLTITVGLLLTGALHEDGLADCADGLGGGATAERALEIMRDSRIGTYGALALLVSVLLRVACLSLLGLTSGALALIIAATLGRAAMVPTLILLPYARPSGVATEAARASGWRTGGIAVGTAAGLAVGLGGVAGLAAVLVAIAAWTFVSWRLMRRLGGYTGDGLGATEQVVEITALITLATWWGAAA